MKNLRQWQLRPEQPFHSQLAADARMGSTDYVNDQIWELSLGVQDAPALALKTTYGGRAGQVSLVPMWQTGGRIVYQAQGYAEPFTLTSFMPNYLQARAKLTPTLGVRAECWVMDSHSVGGRFTVLNTTQVAEQVSLTLFGHVGIQSVEQKPGIGALRTGGNALLLGSIGNLQPVVVLEGAVAETDPAGISSPKISVEMLVPARSQIIVRWVHAGMPTMQESAELAIQWLNRDWGQYLRAVVQAAQAIPEIVTGDDALDVTIASSYQQLMQAFVGPSGSLPCASLVARRDLRQGYSRRGDGSDYPRAWSGQPVQLAYPAALAAATIDPALAQGIVRNYLAVQGADGWIDMKPGLGGQRGDLLCAPLLARLAWGIYQQTHDSAFLQEVFVPLRKFFARWFKPDHDADADGVPEWQHERQTGYVYLPTFGVGQHWAQNADINKMEAPDLLALLLSEASSLHHMAQTLGDQAAAKALAGNIKALEPLLDDLWTGEVYGYRDRDQHTRTPRQMVLDDGRGDEEHLPALKLNMPARLIVRVKGSMRSAPNMTLLVTGLDTAGREIREQVDYKAFTWNEGYGVYTTQQVFAQVDRVRCEGLSRVFRVQAAALDTTRLDINALLPLCSQELSKKRAKEVIRLLKDEQHFWRPNGISMTSAQDPQFDPSNANGGGGVWLFWQTLLGEALLDQGELKLATALVQRLLAVQHQVFRVQRAFSEFYHSDQPEGSGETGSLAGIVPLYLLLRVLGVQIPDHTQVITGGEFAWAGEVTVRQHGIAVHRTAQYTVIKFVSGHEVTLTNGDKAQRVVDPNPPRPSRIAVPPAAPAGTTPQPKQSPTQKTPPARIQIPIDFEDD